MAIQPIHRLMAHPLAVLLAIALAILVPGCEAATNPNGLVLLPLARAGVNSTAPRTTVPAAAATAASGGGSAHLRAAPHGAHAANATAAKAAAAARLAAATTAAAAAKVAAAKAAAAATAATVAKVEADAKAAAVADFVHEEIDNPLDEAALSDDGVTEERLLAIRKQLADAAAKKWKLTAAQAAAVGDPSLEGKIRICVYPTTPYAFCNTSDPETTFEGYEVQLFREVSRRVPWLDIGDWAFQCVPFDNLDYGELNGTCLISLGGLDASNTFQTGLRSSYSTAESGWQILVRANEKNTVDQLFSPFRAFSWQLWLTYVMTAIGVAICLWLFDSIVKYTVKKSAERAQRLAELEDATFKSDDGGTGQDMSDDDGTDTGTYTTDNATDGEKDGDVEGGKDADVGIAKEADQKEDGAKGDGDGKGDKADDGGYTPSKDAPKDVESPGGGDAPEEAPAPSKPRNTSQVLMRWKSMLKHSHDDEKVALQNLDKTVRVMLLNLARVTTPPPTTSLASQIVLFAWGILTMIVVSMFTGATAAGLTAQQLSGGITSLKDLRERPVIVWNAYAQDFKFAGIKPIPMPVENLEDEARMLKALRDHKADAIVMESNWVGYYSNKYCNLVPAGDIWDKVFVAFKFNLRMSSALEDDINAAIVQCKVDDVFDRVQKLLSLSKSMGSGCARDNKAKSPTVYMKNVAGLWVMLGIAMVLGLLILAATWVWQMKYPDISRGLESAFSGQAFTGANFIRFPFNGGGGGGGGLYGPVPYGHPADGYGGRSFQHSDSYDGPAGSYKGGSFRRADSFSSQYEDEDVGELRGYAQPRASYDARRGPGFNDQLRFATLNARHGRDGRALGRMNSSRVTFHDQGGATFNDRGRGMFSDRGRRSFHDDDGDTFDDQGGPTLNRRGGATFDRRGGAAFNRGGGATFNDRRAVPGAYNRVPTGINDTARQRAFQRAPSAIDRQQMAAQHAMRQGHFTHVDMGGM